MCVCCMLRAYVCSSVRVLHKQCGMCNAVCLCSCVVCVCVCVLASIRVLPLMYIVYIPFFRL